MIQYQDICRKKFNIDGLVDMVTFQFLDMVFNNVREVGVLEEVVCDPNIFVWEPWEAHIREFDQSKYGHGRALLTFPTGIASEEYEHGGAQFFTPSLYYTRKAFTFRERFIVKAKKRLKEIVDHYVKRMKKKKKIGITADDCDIVGVHIRRTDHIEFEKLNGADHLKPRYFVQAMETFSDKLQHPIFVIVTDDPLWARKEVHKSFKPYFTGIR